MSLAAACCTLLALSCAQQKESADNQEPLTVGNPYMPLCGVTGIWSLSHLNNIK